MIDMPQITEYVSIEKQMLLDAQKYIERAEMYLAIGQLHHCTGCLIKASKKMEKAKTFKFPELEFMRPFMDRLAKQIADNILKA